MKEVGGIIEGKCQVQYNYFGVGNVGTKQAKYTERNSYQRYQIHVRWGDMLVQYYISDDYVLTV